MKCDETKPVCIRCQRAGKKCSGWPDAPLSSAPVRFAATVIYEPGCNIAPAGIKPNLQQLMAFDTLRAQTTLEVAGCFDRSFWQMDMMQAARVYPAIWHAGLAMATMHHRIKMTASSGIKPDHGKKARFFYGKALTYYNSSIRELMKMVDDENTARADQEAILLACLIFTGLCTMMGEINDAITHARNGLQMFYQWRYWETAQSRPRRNCLVTADSLVMAYTHLESQFMNRMNYIDRPTWRGRGRASKCADAPFRSLTDAYFELQPLMNGLIDVGKNHTVPGHVNPYLARGVLEHKHQFNIWRKKFEDLQAASTFHGDDADGLLILKMNANCFALLMDFGYEGSEVAFDSFCSVFEDTIHLAEQLYENRRKEGKLQGYGALQYSFSLSTCEALDFVGHVCRDTVLRRRLIALLKKWSHREGMWDSELIASAIEAHLMVEEEGVEDDADCIGSCACIRGSYICDDHRVCSQDIEFLENGKVRLTLNTIGGIKLGRRAKVVMLR